MITLGNVQDGHEISESEPCHDMVGASISRTMGFRHGAQPLTKRSQIKVSHLLNLFVNGDSYYLSGVWYLDREPPADLF